MTKIKTCKQFTNQYIMDSSSSSHTDVQNQDQPQCPKQEYIHQNKLAVITKRVASFVYNNTLVNIIVYFILCNIVHHYASKLYIYFCAYSTPLFHINSMLMSPVVIISPHCMALRWLILESSNTVYFQILSCCSFIIARLSK